MTERGLRTTLGVGTFSGLGKGRIRLCWDNRRAPNKEEDLSNFLYRCSTIPKQPCG
jgi:hypothetical protein